jgi:hypothetical protein
MLCCLYVTASHQLTHKCVKADSVLHEAGNVPVSRFSERDLRST